MSSGMEEPFLPWWLLLLLVMWATAIVVWQHPTVHREVRLWAGLLALLYLGLIFLALGCVPQASNVILIVCVAVSLTTGVWMLGRISLRSRRICYVTLTASNAVFCALVQGPEIAIGLFLVAIGTARPLVQEWLQTRSGSPRDWLTDLVRFRTEPASTENSGEFWLFGGLCGILACLLIGTFAYSLRIETSRTTFSNRYSVLPSREYLEQIPGNSPEANKATALLDLVTGQRADVFVLMAAIVFLSLAINLNDPRPQAIASADSVDKTAAKTPL